MKTVSTSISDDLFEMLAEAVDEAGVSQSDYLRNIIKFDLEPVNMRVEENVQRNSTGILSKLKKAFGVSEVEVEAVENRGGWSTDANAIWTPSETYRKPYNDLKVYHDTIKVRTNHNAFKSMSISVTQMLCLNEFYKNNGHFLNRNLRDFGMVFGVSDATLKRFVANLMEHELDDIIEEASFVNVDLLDIVKMSRLSFKEINEICGMVANEGFSYEYVLDLQKMYSNHDSYAIRVICENYDNKNLHRLVEIKKKPFVENHPSRRRNLIRNGGIL